MKLNKSSKTNIDLPWELITDILSRLQVKSLLKFRCICKQWLCLISSSQFINAHLNLSKKSYANHTLLLEQYTNIGYYTCTLSSVFDGMASVNTNVLHFPFEQDQREDQRVWITGTCNGLLSGILNAKTQFLYNPSTRKLNILPFSGRIINESRTISITYGFSYDELNDDYKLVELHALYDIHSCPVCTHVRIYSLRNGCWRKIQGHYKGYVCDDGRFRGLRVGGVLYWAIRECLSLIFRVDTVTNTFGTILGPKLDDPRDYLIRGIVDFGGCLGVFQENNKRQVDIWTMNESWTKVLSLPYCVSPRYSCSLCLQLEDGEVLVSNFVERDLKVYNARENSFFFYELGSFHVPRFLPNPVFIESLVEPN